MQTPIQTNQMSRLLFLKKKDIFPVPILIKNPDNPVENIQFGSQFSDRRFHLMNI
jgi:hypothetical protein